MKLQIYYPEELEKQRKKVEEEMLQQLRAQQEKAIKKSKTLMKN